MLVRLEKLLNTPVEESEARSILLKLTPEAVSLPMLRAIVESLRSHCLPVSDALLSAGRQAIDCSGTGGSGLRHFNISTTSAFVLAAAGQKVIKFGNKAATGRCGSFDFLEALGFRADVSTGAQESIFEETGMIFLFARQFYPPLKRIARLRRELVRKTIFNFIGPLLNPARPAFRLLGVCDQHMQRLLGEFLKEDGLKRPLVVRSESGLDEIDCRESTCMLELEGPGITELNYVPSTMGTVDEDFGLLDVSSNVLIFDRILNGQDCNSEHFYRLVLNSGAAFYVCGKVESIRQGTELARTLLAEGYVTDQYQRLRRSYAKHAG